jgi:hypothetical protein
MVTKGYLTWETEIVLGYIKKSQRDGMQVKTENIE